MVLKTTRQEEQLRILMIERKVLHFRYSVSSSTLKEQKPSIIQHRPIHVHNDTISINPLSCKDEKKSDLTTSMEKHHPVVKQVKKKKKDKTHKQTNKQTKNNPTYHVV